MLRSLFKADIKSIIRDPILIIAILSPFLLIIFLKLAFPLISDFIFSKKGFQLNCYYTVVAITVISMVPVLIGVLYALLFIDKCNKNDDKIIPVTSAIKNNFLIMRIIIPFSLSFLLLLLIIFVTDPVPTQGWLRSLYISLLLATQTPFVFLFIGSLAGSRIGGIALSKLYGIFLIAVPLGLLLHHPWNYFAFFSPLYWSSCAWVCSVPVESLIYGAICMVITFGCILIFFRHFLKKHTN
ncbi:MAG: hypothetical protein NT144_09080 [Bacteroidia bacterium]|nr:hypothetical protein [Bacteroidia bacterium]